MRQAYSRAYQRTFSGQRRTIGQQVAIGALVPCALALLIALAVYQLMHDHAELSHQVERSSQRVTLGQQMLISILDLQAGTSDFVIAGERDALTPYQQATDRHAAILAQGRQAWPEGTRQRRLLERFADLFQSYCDEIAEPVIALQRSLPPREQGGDASAQEELEAIISSQRSRALVDEMKRSSRQLIEHARKQVATRTERAELRQRQAQLVGIIGAPLAVLLGLLLVAAAIGRVRHGLQSLADASERVAQGDLAHRIHLEDSRELAQLADSFNRMADVWPSAIGRACFSIG